MIESKEPGGRGAGKTLSNVLLDSRGQFQSMGFQARRDYFEDDENQGQMMLFTNFKMDLHSERATATPQAIAANGRKWPLLQVISAALKFVKDEAMAEVNKAQPKDLTADEIRRVVTVPAIWRDAAKGFMRKAAHQAGLISTCNSRRLVLALEPEAAWCVSVCVPLAGT